MPQTPLVVRLDDLETYSPPLHSGTVNRRLVEASLGAGFEVVHGTIAPGGAGHRHQHQSEWQVILLLEGEGRLQLGDGEPETIAAGTVVRIPPRTPHLFEVTGSTAAKVLVIYAPPLGADGFVAA
ncbi:Cupin domain-containing protein [Tistlia consotensis]|uniref:Cupin domain-containing protein n=1 Tax=Tistlia consotensis USBA 355 TaxID=560819 RepID=A0A1Y6CIT6_9PROT|nr:cupin domain-containing protein [Tistlia consotensis]SMF57081.1 Cupin domain-containing protein [Tistlia consotensis USBA 355]SNR45330.1 Cupin domain-containing protein [Tistlia consotensis]